MRYHLFSLATATAMVLALTPSSTPAATPVDIRQGLVAYWPLESTPDGLITSDLSPFGNHLNLVNMDASNFVPGKFGNAAAFNGSDELLSKIYDAGTGNGLPIHAARRYTIAMWVNGVGATQQDRRVFSEGSTAATAQLFNIGTDSNSSATARTNVVDLFVRNDANTAVISHRKSTGMAFDGTWHHIAWVEEDGIARLYIDGQLDATVFNYTRSGTFSFNTISLGAIQRATAGAWFNGLIDDAAIWERPLAQSEIQDLIANSLTTPVPEFPPFIILEPQSVTAALGDNVTLRAQAVGNRPISYQWVKGTEDIPDATSATLTLLNVSAADAADYTVRVSNVEGSSTSAVATLTVVPDPPADLEEGLISYWPFDEVDETALTTPDLYSQNNMALVGMNSLNLVEGHTGLSNALTFDGVSQYTRRVGGFPIYNSPTHSISFWVKGDGLTQTDLRVFAEGSTNSNTPLFTIGTQAGTAGTSLRMFIRNDANGTVLNAQTTRPVFDDTWHHVVWVDSNGVARVYVDGVQDPTSFRYTRSVLTLNTTAVGAILRAAASSYFRGTIDEVAVWNRTLSYTEVQAIFTGRVPPPTQVIPPEITKQPVGADVFEGANLTLSVEAIGTAVEFQWLKNGEDIPDATNSVLLLPAAVGGNSGTYTVRVSNSANSVVSSPAVVVVSAIVDATTGLVAYWPFDVVSSGITPDTTPNGFDMTLVNMDETNLVPGKRGNALAFNGTDELTFRNHVTPSTLGLPIYQHGNGYTVAFWANGAGNAQPSTPNNGDRRVFSESSTLSDSPLVNIGTDNANASTSVDIYIRNDSNGVAVEHRKSATGGFDGTWHHIAWVDEGGNARLYVDGVLDGTSMTYTRPVITPNVTSIGAIRRAATSHWFLGLVDDVAVWRRALTEAEVKYVMNNGAVPPPELHVDRIEVNGDVVVLTFTVPDPLTFYCVKESENITEPNWVDVSDLSVAGVEGNVFRAQFTRTPGSQRFYRVYMCP